MTDSRGFGGYVERYAENDETTIIHVTKGDLDTFRETLAEEKSRPLSRETKEKQGTFPQLRVQSKTHTAQRKNMAGGNPPQ